jgi:thiazole synthase ThiGH ThiG subunit
MLLQTMELGADAVLVNTAIAVAKMAEALEWLLTQSMRLN